MILCAFGEGGEAVFAVLRRGDADTSVREPGGVCSAELDSGSGRGGGGETLLRG